MAVSSLSKQYFSFLKSTWISRLFIVMALILSVLLPSQTIKAASGRTYTVNPGQSIQNTLNQMSGGDILEILPGTYHGSVVISQSDITFRKSPVSSGEVVINGNGSENVISVQNVRVTLDGLSITNSTVNGILLDGSGCRGSSITNCRITEWGLREATDSGTLCAGIQVMNAGNNLVQKCYLQRGTHDDAGCSESNYSNEVMNWHGILLNRSPGGHQILDNELWGASPDGRHNLCDVLTNSDWAQPDSSWNDSTIARNKIFGGWDELIQIDGDCVNVTIENNYLDGMGSRAVISTNPCYSGPIYIKNNTIKNYSQIG